VDYAHVLLPIGLFTETSGTYVSTEGRVQSFSGVVRSLGESRPAWKVLRVLGNLLGLAGFAYESADEVKREALGDGNVTGRLGNRLKSIAPAQAASAPATGLQRIGEVPIYAADAIVRRARSLQRTRGAGAPVAWMSRALYEKLGLRDGDAVKVRQGGGEAIVAAGIDGGLPDDCIRLAAARAETATLGPMLGGVTAERVPARQKVAV
jgi:NADH-quinone oxidoreductase subunit G